MKSLSEFNPTIHKMYMEQILKVNERMAKLEQERGVYISTGAPTMPSSTNWMDLDGDGEQYEVEPYRGAHPIEHSPIMDTEDMDIPEDIKARIRGDYDDRPWYQRDIDEFKNLGKRIATMVNSVFRMEGEQEVDDDLAES